MRYLVVGSMLLVASLPVLGQGKRSTAPGAKKAEQACRAVVAKYLKGRRLKRLAKLVSDPRNSEFKLKGKFRRARYELRPRAIRRAEWGFLPKAYCARFDRKEFVPYFRPQNSRPIVDSFSIGVVTVSREAVRVVYSWTPVRPFAYFTEETKARTYKRPARTVAEVLVRQGGRFVLSRRFVPLKGRKKNAAMGGDFCAVAGEVLVEHPWWAGTMSVNAMLAKHAESRVKAQGTKSAREAAGALQAALEGMRRLLETTEIADRGRVMAVEAGRVQIVSGGLEFRIPVPKAEAETRGAFYKALKKGDVVAFRCRFVADNATDFTPQARSDGKATLEAWKE